MRPSSTEVERLASRDGQILEMEGLQLPGIKEQRLEIMKGGRVTSVDDQLPEYDAGEARIVSPRVIYEGRDVVKRACGDATREELNAPVGLNAADEKANYFTGEDVEEVGTAERVNVPLAAKRVTKPATVGSAGVGQVPQPSEFGKVLPMGMQGL